MELNYTPDGFYIESAVIFLIAYTLPISYKLEIILNH